MNRPSCLLILPLLLAGCNWSMWLPFIDLDEAPAISISSPTEGQAFASGDTPTLIAWVTAGDSAPAENSENAEGAAPALNFELIVDGSVVEPTLTASTFASITHPLPATDGAHQLTLTARDAAGALDRATVSYSVGDPTVQGDSDEPSDSDTDG